VRGARHFTELDIWQLADQIRAELFGLTSRPAFARDLKARSQADDAANSVCRNIAEGFGCEHTEFARFLVIARRSLNELQDTLRGAELKGYVTAQDCAPIRMLLRRLFPALSSMLAYLRRTPDYGKPGTAKRTDTREHPRTDQRKKARTDER
jgi:four helix bundle protein